MSFSRLNWPRSFSFFFFLGRGCGPHTRKYEEKNHFFNPKKVYRNIARAVYFVIGSGSSFTLGCYCCSVVVESNRRVDGGLLCHGGGREGFFVMDRIRLPAGQVNRVNTRPTTLIKYYNCELFPLFISFLYTTHEGGK